MDRYFRYWWLGVRQLICFGIAWALATLPLTIGGLVLRERIEAHDATGVAAVVCGILYAALLLPVLFAILSWPLPSAAPTAPDPRAPG
jgi:hypothetical protein